MRERLGGMEHAPEMDERRRLEVEIDTVDERRRLEVEIDTVDERRRLEVEIDAAAFHAYGHDR